MTGPTTYEAFLAAVGDLDVVGIESKLDAPPTKLDTAELPASFPAATLGQVLSEGYMTVGTHGGWPHFTASLIVVMEPVGQSTLPENHKAAVAMIDNLTAALRASPVAGIGKSDVSWSVSLSPDFQVGTTAYWAVVATIDGHG